MHYISSFHLCKWKTDGTSKAYSILLDIFFSLQWICVFKKMRAFDLESCSNMISQFATLIQWMEEKLQMEASGSRPRREASSFSFSSLSASLLLLLLLLLLCLSSILLCCALVLGQKQGGQPPVYCCQLLAPQCQPWHTGETIRTRKTRNAQDIAEEKIQHILVYGFQIVKDSIAKATLGCLRNLLYNH